MAEQPQEVSPDVRLTGDIHVKLRRHISEPPALHLGKTLLDLHPVQVTRPDPHAVAARAGVHYVGAVAPSGVRLRVVRHDHTEDAFFHLAPDHDELEVQPALADWHTFRVTPASLLEFNAAADVEPGASHPAVDAAVWQALERIYQDPNVVIAEPDLEQGFAEVPPSGESPLPDVDWHLRRTGTRAIHDQLLAEGRVPGAGVRIAHLDTGYRPHDAFEKSNLRLELAWDEWENKAGAVDPLTGIIKNKGHGTGTLSILAGRSTLAAPAGCEGVAWGAEVFPVRISPTVILIRTSSLARGLGRALQSVADVVTLSMGGLPSQLWADAVNDAYEAGMVVVAAAGNTRKLVGPAWSPHHVVYPARFNRVIAVGGIQKDGKPYENYHDMGACHGQHVDVCAPTPGVRWANGEDPNSTHDYLFGEGTSSATPQVAGLAALWLQRHGPDAGTGAFRTEACRRAVLQSAQWDAAWKSDGQGKDCLDELMRGRSHNTWYGYGCIDAVAALKLAPPAGPVATMPPDDVFFSGLDALLRDRTAAGVRKIVGWIRSHLNL